MFITVICGPRAASGVVGTFADFAAAAAAASSLDSLIVEFSHVVGWLRIWERGAGVDRWDVLAESSSLRVLEARGECAA